MTLDNMLDNRKAKPCAAGLLGARLIYAVKPFKYALLVFLRNPDACVRYPQTYQPVLD